jgi:pyruvate formate lyase activating enzyme
MPFVYIMRFTTFYPAYRMQDHPPTDIATLRRAREIGLAEGLSYVYQGNVSGEAVENTYCYHCKTLLIKRFGFAITQNHIREDGSCPVCGSRIDGIGMSGIE